MEDWIKSAIESAQQKLDTLVADRTKIDREIVSLKAVIDALQTVADEADSEMPPDLEFPGASLITEAGIEPAKITFADAVRMVLRDANEPLTAPQIRDALVSRRFNMSKYQQELVPIHNTLKRLWEKGEVERYQISDNQTGYKWVSPISRVLKRPDPLGDTSRLKTLAEILNKQHADFAEQLSGIRSGTAGTTKLGDSLNPKLKEGKK